MRLRSLGWRGSLLTVVAVAGCATKTTRDLGQFPCPEGGNAVLVFSDRSKELKIDQTYTIQDSPEGIKVKQGDILIVGKMKVGQREAEVSHSEGVTVTVSYKDGNFAETRIFDIGPTDIQDKAAWLVDMHCETGTPVSPTPVPTQTPEGGAHISSTTNRSRR